LNLGWIVIASWRHEWTLHSDPMGVSLARDPGVEPPPSADLLPLAGRGGSISSRDVAVEAGVSQSTVSRVLNANANVSPETRQRVEAAIERLAYIPNAAARSLITHHTRLLGLVVSNITNGFYPEIIAAVTKLALEEGYTVVVGSAGERVASQATYLRLLAEQRVDGVILTSTLLGEAREVTALAKAGLPIVLANRVRDELPVDSVGLDNVEAGHLATEHLLEHGRRRIAFVGGRLDATTSLDRYRGYRESLAAAGIAEIPALVSDGEFTWASGYERTRDLLKVAAIDAIVAADDTIALGCMDALADVGLAVPGAVAVVGFDDIAAAGLRAVSLTTIGTSARQMGTEAATLLLDRIRRREVGPPRRVVLAPRLVVRHSCGDHAEHLSA
jgi:LacI family transcriptional regulator